MSQGASLLGEVVPITPGTREFEESMEMLRHARTSLSDMCRVIAMESGIRTVPSFSPDQADWCGDSGQHESADWSIRVGFGGCVPARVIGTYDELCKEWMRGPESFHDWVGGMVIDASRKSLGGDEAESHDDLHDEPEPLADPAARSVAEAKVGLMACGYLMSPAAIPDYMDACTFVAWDDDTLTFVAVTDDDDVPARSEALRRDILRWGDEGGRPRTDIKAIVVSVDDGRLSTSEVAL